MAHHRKASMFFAFLCQKCSKGLKTNIFSVDGKTFQKIRKLKVYNSFPPFKEALIKCLLRRKTLGEYISHILLRF